MLNIDNRIDNHSEFCISGAEFRTPHSLPLTLKKYISPEEIRDTIPGGNGGIGFLFHATDWETLSFSLENVKSHSPAFEEELWNTKPFIASPIYMGNELIGANIACPVPLELWMGRPNAVRRFRETQFFPALELAKQAGLTMLAMGASTPYVCNYGKLARPAETPFLTTGHAATAAMLKNWAMRCCDLTGIHFTNARIALFGAAGRLGSAVANYLKYERSPKEIVLIDLPDKISLLRSQAQELEASSLLRNCKISIHAFSPYQPLPEFDGAILTSCTSTPFLTANDLRKARFWIDDSHPRAASMEVELATSHDTLYIECFARGPSGLNTEYPFRLLSSQDCYTCFAEGFVAWQENIQEDFVTGIPSVETIAYVDSLLEKHSFTTGPLLTKSGAPFSYVRHPEIAPEPVLY